MKFYYLCLIILPLFISCSDSKESESFEGKAFAVKNNINNPSTNRGYDIMPANSSNPYDKAGQIQNEILESYYSWNPMVTDVEDIADVATSIANENSSFAALRHGYTYGFSSTDRVHYILDNLDSCSLEIISTSLDTENAIVGLSNFMDSFLSLCETQDDYSAIYRYVVSYEQDVLYDPNLTERDKKVILTTTSIARYSAYLKKKRPKRNTDPEWGLMTANIVAAIDGANGGLEQALMMATIAGVAENTK